MAETLDLSLFVEPSDAGASHMTLAVEGVSCAGCIRKIENGLNKLPGVIDARLNFTQRRLAVDWRNDETDAAKIIAAIETIGYHAHPFAPERADADESAPSQVADEMPRRRGLCRDERDAAVGIGLGRQRLRHDAGDARPVSLAVRA